MYGRSLRKDWTTSCPYSPAAKFSGHAYCACTMYYVVHPSDPQIERRGNSSFKCVVTRQSVSPSVGRSAFSFVFAHCHDFGIVKASRSPSVPLSVYFLPASAVLSLPFLFFPSKRPNKWMMAVRSPGRRPLPSELHRPTTLHPSRTRNT